jgi:uncharacterized protein (TIRG00374 family)
MDASDAGEAGTLGAGPPAGPTEPGAVPPPRFRRGAWATGAVLLAAVVVGAAHLGEEHQFAALLRRARPAWLLAALALQAGTYACAAAVWERVLTSYGERRRLWRLVPLGLAKLFTDQAVPSAGMSGTLLVVYALGHRGVSRGVALLAVLVGLVGFYGAYALAVGAALVILWSLGELSRLLLGVATVFSLLATAVPLAIYGLYGRAGRAVPAWARRHPFARSVLDSLAEAPPGALRDPRLVTEAVGLQLAVFVLDAATLGVMLRAVGTPAAAPAVFASFVVASVVATLAWVPGGLGTFEGSCVAMLRLQGTPIEAALAATLLLRGFTFWLPMVPGLWLARREMMRPVAGSG